MPELFIPDKLKSTVMISPTPMWGPNRDRKAGEYDPVTDTITLDPNLADVAVLCEELWHRKQEEIIRRLGLPPVFRGRKNYIQLFAKELGIAPRTRDVAVRLNLEQKTHHRRYFRLLLEPFTTTCLRYYREETRRYFQALKGEKLFDGLAFILQECYKPGFDYVTWPLSRYQHADKPEDTIDFWNVVNKSRKSW